MPILSISDTGTITSSRDLEPGTYNAAQLVITEKARLKHAFFLDDIGIRLIKKDENIIVWTESFGSCFPVIFTFKNGDIAFCHHNRSDIKPFKELLDRKDITEIQAIGKKEGTNIRKIEALALDLTAYFKNKKNKPKIKIAITQLELFYSVGLCYKSANGQPIILIGYGSNEYIIPKNVNECLKSEDVVTYYEFISAYDHDYASLNEAQFKMSLGLFQELPPIEVPQNTTQTEEQAYLSQDDEQLIPLDPDPKKQCVLF